MSAASWEGFHICPFTSPSSFLPLFLLSLLPFALYFLPPFYFPYLSIHEPLSTPSPPPPLSNAPSQAGHVCGDSIDLVDGYPTGSVRISFGYMSTFEDAQRFLNFIAQCFVDSRPQIAEENPQPAGSKVSPTTVATHKALQVSSTGSHSNQEIGLPATERDLAAARGSKSVKETQVLAAVRDSESVREIKDLVNQRMSCYPSPRASMEEQPRLHGGHDSGLVVGEQFGVQEGQSSQDDVMSNGGTSSGVGGSGVGLRVGEVLQVFLEDKQGTQTQRRMEAGNGFIGPHLELVW